MRWLNAGHPRPLHVRGGSFVGALSCSPTLPVGLGGTVTEIAEEWLEPRDTVLFYTDGLVEARSPDGDFYGEDRLVDGLVRAIIADLPAAETARRLVQGVLAYQQERLQDDATTLLLHWHGAGGGRL